MPDKKISQLTAGGAAQATDEYVIARSGNNFKVTGANVAAAATSVGTLTSLTVNGTGGLSFTGTPYPYIDAGGIYVDGGYSAYIRGSSRGAAGAAINFYTHPTSAGALRWQIDANGHFLAGADNSFDIGASGANRPRNVYAGTSVIAPKGNFSGVQDTLNATYTQNGESSLLNLRNAQGGTAAIAALFIGNDASSAAAVLRVYSSAYTTSGLAIADSLRLNGNRPGGITINAADIAGAIRFATGGFTETMRLDSNGNFGLGVVPSPWTVRALQVGATTAVWQESASTFLSANVYFDGSNRYISTAAASRYEQNAGSHRWFSAASGTAGNTITFTQAMTLFASGSLTIGGTNDSARLRVEGSTNLTTALQLFRTGNTCGAIWQENGAMRFGVNGSDGFNERWAINNSGHFLAGVDNTYDIGASGATRPRSVYVGTSVVTPTVTNSNTLDIAATGANIIMFATNGVNRWYVGSTGHFFANADNTLDIGASGANRPRTVYAATSVEGGYIRAGAASAGAASTTTIGNGTATTVGAAGGASALPATPLGYIIAHVGTTQVKIPYYNN